MYFLHFIVVKKKTMLRFDYFFFHIWRFLRGTKKFQSVHIELNQFFLLSRISTETKFLLVKINLQG